VVTFTGLDFFVVAAVFAATITLGFSAKLRNNTSLQLLAAGRKLTLPLFVATLVTTWYGGILGVGEAFDAYGWSSWIALGVPYYVFGLVYALMFARRVRIEEQISLPERFERCYGLPSRLFGAVLVLLLGIPAAHVFMLAALTQAVGGPQIPLATAAVIGAAIGTAALYRGGLLADARANLAAFVMMYVSFIVIVIESIVHPSHAHPLPATHTSWDGGQGVLFVIGWFLIGSWTLVDPGFHQRAASAETPEVSRRGVIVSVAFWVLFDALTLTTAYFAYRALGPGLGAKLFIAYGDAALPNGLKGVFFAGMLGVILAAMTGYSLVSGGTIGRDIFGRVLGIQTERSLANASRAGVAVSTVLAIVLALTVKSVVYLWYDVGGLAIPGLLVPTIFAYSGRVAISAGTALASMIGGSGGAAAWLILKNEGWLSKLGEYGKLHHIYAGLGGAAAALSIGMAIERTRRTR